MIDILMATYNGGQFIENQLLSLLSQTHKDWRLFVHDDGSSDNTISIIQRYVSLDDRIIWIDDQIVLGNAGANFLHLLSYANSEFVIFCDQDDFWFESKLEILFEGLKSSVTPAAIYCNAYGYNGRVITSEKVSLIERTDLANSLFLNSGVQGCSLMFNRQLRDIMIDTPDYTYMHDHYITMGAVSFGDLKYIDKSLMLYRQHDRNVTGNVPISILDRIKTFLNKDNAIIDEKHYRANRSFFEKFSHRLSDDQKQVFEAYLQFPKMNLISKIYNVVKYRFRIGQSQTVLIAKLFFKKII